MKKTALILVLMVLGVFAVVSTAGALESPYTHGDFATGSKGCGECHVTHAAQGAKLLAKGTGSQTSFCLGCHAQSATSPFDVYNGLIISDADYDPTNPAGADWNILTATISNSLAGGFKSSWDFGGRDALGALDETQKDSTSMHNVAASATEFGANANADAHDYEYVAADVVPGSTNKSFASNAFECGSCHDPHAGGAYDPTTMAGTKNPRLLRVNLGFVAGDHDVVMHFNNASNTVASYDSGFNGWCGACHDVFNTSAMPGGGDDRSGGGASFWDGDGITRHAYMHKFGINVSTDNLNYPSDALVGDPFVAAYIPVESEAANVGVISCISCHRAHGSAAEALPSSWNRYDTYKGYDNTGAGNVTTGAIKVSGGKGSALLRLPQRDVCYDCHGAAKFNKDKTYTD